MACLFGNLVQGHTHQTDRILLRLIAFDRDRAAAHSIDHCCLNCGHANCACLSRVALRNHPREGALEIPECIRAHTLYFSLLPQGVSQQIAQCASAAQLSISVIIHLFGELCNDRHTLFIRYPL